MMKYYNPVSKSEAKYYIDSNEGEIKISGGAQGSYNLKSEILTELTKHNVLIKDPSFEYDRKDKDGSAYVLANEYSLQLGTGILWLIGNEYSGSDNKFIASINSSNGKFQMYRTVYRKLNQNQYGWFVKLYDKNLTGNDLIFRIDAQNKVLHLDVKFNAIENTIDSTSLSLEEDVTQYIRNECDDCIEIDYPHNRIVFGAPGTGKSNRLENDRLLFNQNFERVTFHPNYSYSHFVGTYKPVPIGDKITYDYVAGPFMRILSKAMAHPECNYLLLIEEINRANVAAVFGDVFQLLDRKNGESEYEIETSEDMRKYLSKELKCDMSQVSKIKIPKNMYIWATMNSADQGVFPMDTAFKRRWDFEYIGIDENADGIKHIKIRLGKDSHEVCWNDLRIAINHKLSVVCKVNEDKLLGPYFLSNDVIKTTEGSEYVEDNEKFIKAFKNKVLMYLYEDAAKQHKSKLFEGCPDYSKYSSVCDEFERIGELIFGKDILSKIKGKE